jgi:hypothetical protein
LSHACTPVSGEPAADTGAVVANTAPRAAGAAVPGDYDAAITPTPTVPSLPSGPPSAWEER